MHTAKATQKRTPRPWRYTVEQYDRIAAGGVFDRQRVELIEGRIIVMAAQYEPHVAGVSLAARAAERAFGPGCWVRRQNPIRLGKRSKPEPDVAVVEGAENDYIDRGPPDKALLVIEVSDTTLRYDRGLKAAMYARFGVLDYWILNLIDRQLEVYREPIADASHRLGFRYSNVSVLKVGDVIVPLASKHATIAVADIMPRQPSHPSPPPPGHD